MAYDVSLLLDGLILVFLCATIFYAARLSLFMKSFREGRSDMQRLIRDLSTTIDKAESSVAVMKDNAKATEVEIRTIINEAKFLSDELKFMNETGDGLADRLEKLADRNRELVDLMESSGGIGTQRIEPYEPRPEKAAPKMPPVEDEDDDVFKIMDFDVDPEDIDEDDEADFLALSDGAYREEDILRAPEKVEEEVPSFKSQVNTKAKSKVRSFAIFDRDYDDVMEDEADEADVVGASSKDKTQQFHSRAEQDLYEALQRKKRAFDEEKGQGGKSKHVSKLT